MTREMLVVLSLAVVGCAAKQNASTAPVHPQVTASLGAEMDAMGAYGAQHTAGGGDTATVAGGGEAASDGEGCAAYSEAVGTFFTDMQKEYAQFQADAESKGADAYEHFGTFLKDGAAKLKKIKAEGAPAAAHAALVAAIGKMGDDFLALAAAVRANSEAKMKKAENALEASTKRVGDAFDQLKAACG